MRELTYQVAKKIVTRPFREPVPEKAKRDLLMIHLSIRNRIYLICVVSLLAFVTMVVINVYQQYQVRLSIVDMQKNTTLFSAASHLIGNLQKERGKTALFHAGGVNPGALEEQRKKTDVGLRAMLQAFRASSLARGKNQGKVTSIPKVLTDLREANNQTNPKRREQAMGEYTGVIRTLFSLLSDIANSKTTKGFGKEFSSMLLLETAKENAGLLRANVSSILARGTPLSQDELTRIINLKSGIETTLNSPALVLSSSMRERLARLSKSPDWLAVDKTFQLMVTHSGGGNFQTGAGDFWKHSTREVDDLGEFIDAGLTKMNSKLQSIIDQVNSGLVRVAIILLGVIVFIIFLTLKTSFYIINGLKSAVDSMRDIAAGEGDLTRRLEVRGNDEIADIARSFNTFVEKIQQVVNRISENADKLTSSSDGLLAVSGQMASGGREIFEKAATVAGAAEQSSANTGSVAEGMEQLSVNISSVASATEEMSATIGEIASNSESARANSAEAAQQTEGVSEIMKELGRAAEEIGYVNETIRGNPIKGGGPASLEFVWDARKENLAAAIRAWAIREKAGVEPKLKAHEDLYAAHEKTCPEKAGGVLTLYRAVGYKKRHDAWMDRRRELEHDRFPLEKRLTEFEEFATIESSESSAEGILRFADPRLAAALDQARDQKERERQAEQKAQQQRREQERRKNAPPRELAEAFWNAVENESRQGPLDTVLELYPQLSVAVEARQAIAKDPDFRPDRGLANGERLSLATGFICELIAQGDLDRFFDLGSEEGLELIKEKSSQRFEELNLGCKELKWEWARELDEPELEREQDLDLGDDIPF